MNTLLIVVAVVILAPVIFLLTMWLPGVVAWLFRAACAVAVVGWFVAHL